MLTCAALIPMLRVPRTCMAHCSASSTPRTPTHLYSKRTPTASAGTSHPLSNVQVYKHFMSSLPSVLGNGLLELWKVMKRHKSSHPNITLWIHLKSQKLYVDMREVDNSSYYWWHNLYVCSYIKQKDKHQLPIISPLYCPIGSILFLFIGLAQFMEGNWSYNSCYQEQIANNIQKVYH